MTKDEALKLALEALEGADMIDCDMRDAITAIKEALAQPEQDGKCKYCTDGCLACDARKLPQRTWVGLTDEEIQYCVELKNPEAIAEEVEAKLKEKNT